MNESKRDAIDDAVDDIMSELKSPGWELLDVAGVIRVLRSDPLCPSDISDDQLRPIAERLVERFRARRAGLS